MKTKLSIGGTLREVFAIYWAEARVLLLFALAVSALTVGPELLFKSAIGVVGGLVLGAAGAVLFQGVAASLVNNLRNGDRRRSAGDLLRSVAPVALPLIGAGILAFVGTTIGFILLIVPGLILLTIWAVIAPVIVLERVGAFESFGRSQALIRENGERVFAVMLLMGLLVFGASFAGIPVSGGSSDITLGPVLVSLAAVTITTPLMGIAPAVLYFRLRAIEDWPGPTSPR